MIYQYYDIVNRIDKFIWIRMCDERVVICFSFEASNYVRVLI